MANRHERHIHRSQKLRTIVPIVSAPVNPSIFEPFTIKREARLEHVFMGRTGKLSKEKGKAELSSSPLI
jgi:hypothetical protein